MAAIIIAVIIAFIIQLAIWEGVVLGIAWGIGKLADISVNYPLIGVIVLGLWALALTVKILFIIGSYRLAKKADEDFEAQRRRMFGR